MTIIDNLREVKRPILFILNVLSLLCFFGSRQTLFLRRDEPLHVQLGFRHRIQHGLLNQGQFQHRVVPFLLGLETDFPIQLLSRFPALFYPVCGIHPLLSKRQRFCHTGDFLHVRTTLHHAPERICALNLRTLSLNGFEEQSQHVLLDVQKLL